jgi:hypothetical protein
MYNTRKKYRPGYYKQLIQGKNSDLEVKIKNKKSNEFNINGLIKLINFNILKNFKSSRKSSPTRIIKLMIDNNIFIFLKNKFQFTSKYKESAEFLSKYNLEYERCENERYYTTASNFAFKINKGRKIKFNQRKDGNIISREITSNDTLSVSFFDKNFP